jgi:cyclopropane-fatty-acyl-phospholipid synthase
MSLKAAATRIADYVPVPDAITRFAIETLVRRTRVSLPDDGEAATRDFAKAMTGRPIAAHTEAANAQHYEVPAEFFELVLGPRRKYSCCLYDGSDTTLAEAEERALAETLRRARIGQGMRILELGCGWGSLSLFMAEKLPQSTILAVSNSHSQRAFIEARANALRLDNLQVVTADVNDFAPDGTFDRVISVEMFEHVSNWSELLSRARPWLDANGLLFLHVFSHARVPYRFNQEDPNDWIAQHFFTGGIMPSHNLISVFSDLFEVVETWRWNGRHYERTAKDWVANMDRNEARVMKVFESVYGEDARVWWRRWRLFFLATAGLFGHRAGKEWGVSHHLLRPVR